jgi:N-methylhydantoinase A/acetophenone carboxylase
MEDICAEDIGNLIKAGGYNPADFVLFSFGGAGGTYCGGIADKVGIPRIYCFRFSSVFSAFGSSCADVLHTYESLAKLPLKRKGGRSEIESFNKVVKGLMGSLLKDMRGEGFPPEKVSFSLELEVDSGNESAVLKSPLTLLEGPRDTGRILDAFAEQNGRGSVEELTINLLRLRATSPTAHPEIATYQFAGEDPGKALKGHRDVYWKNGFIRTAIYQMPELECGNVIKGPAIIESDDTTILIPVGKKYTVDELLNGIIDTA